MQRQTSSRTLADRGGFVSVLQSRRFEDTVTMYDWHNEWATAPYDPLPSNLNRLRVLTRPANINMKTHAQKARRVSLIHYDLQLIPEGRALQESRRKHETIERHFEYDPEDFVMEMEKERAEKRHEVIKAARAVEVIDLTKDERFDELALRNLHLDLAASQRPNIWPDVSEIPLSVGCYHNPAISFTSRRNEQTAKAPWRISAQDAPHRPPGSTRFIQESSLPKKPDHSVSHDVSRPSAFDVLSGYQFTCLHSLSGVSPISYGFSFDNGCA